jgi:hypothetical protein
MRILVATDAWHPQVNGAVRTFTAMADARLSVMTISPQACREFAAGHSRKACARAFLDNMTDIRTVDRTDDAMPFTGHHPRFAA